MRGRMIIGLLFYAEVIHSDRHVRPILQAFFKQLTNKNSMDIANSILKK
jgi:hypothetical protein